LTLSTPPLVQRMPARRPEMGNSMKLPSGMFGALCALMRYLRENLWVYPRALGAYFIEQRMKYGELMHRIHAPIMVIGLVALLGVWQDPVHMAVTSAFGVIAVCALCVQQLKHSRHRNSQQNTQSRRFKRPSIALAAVAQMPLQWQRAANRSAGAPPCVLEPRASFYQSRRHGRQTLFGARGVLIAYSSQTNNNQSY